MSPSIFTGVARLLHWVMAVLIVLMLLLGIGMMSGEPERYSALVMIHRSMGMVVLVLAAIRLVYRLTHPAPPLPADLPALQRFAAKASHLVLYALMFGLPLVGWAMLSAEGYPVFVFGSVHLPAILPADAVMYAHLRLFHALLADLLFATLLAHIGAALFHGLIRRDGVLGSMASVRRG